MQMTTRSTRKQRFARRAGLTLIEMILSLTITALVGLGIASILLAVTTGTSNNTDIRELVLRRKITTVRVDAALRSSKQVLALGGDHVVLWMSDTNADGAVQLSELRRIEYASANSVLRSYRMPASFTPAQIATYEVTYASGTDYSTVTAALRGSTQFPAEIWCNGVTAWNVTTDHGSLDQVRLISYRFTLSDGPIQDIVIGAAALRLP